MPITPVDVSGLEESHSDGGSQGFPVREYGSIVKAAFYSKCCEMEGLIINSMMKRRKWR